jgi:hypothetical protein
MIVVSNTSPLTNLAAIGRFDLLHQLYGEIYIPEAVLQELSSQGQQWPGYHETVQSAWIFQHPVQNTALVKALQRDLDAGESEAIAMAIEYDAGLLLMDEREGRHQAKRFGLKVLGVIGVLLEAKAQQKIAQIQPELDALRQKAGFHLSQEVYDLALGLAGE